MKFALGSDLHLEQNIKNCPNRNTQNADVLILAGDICDLSVIRAPNAIDWFKILSQEFETILWVFGNHEYYEGDLSTAILEYNQFLKQIGVTNIHILDNMGFVIGDIQFVGSTFWTNFKQGDPQIMWDCQRGISDYRYIKIDNRRLTALDILEKHQDCLEYIKRTIQYSDKQLVVITHHQPTWYRAVLEHGMGNLNYAYYSEYSELIMDHTDKIPYWLSGHTHTNRDDMLDNTRLVTNCRGYYGYETMANKFDFKYFMV
jgi:predicted phosphodiesterase